MRVLVATWGWRSQFYPLVPMAWALVAAGHEVRVACPPSLVADVVGAGLPAVAVGADVGFAEVFAGKVGRVGAPDTAPAITADGGVVALADAMLDDLLAYARGFAPALVVHEMLNLAATVAAAVLGVPAVRVLWGPDSSTALGLDAAALLGPRAARFGVDAVPDPAGTLTLDPCPPGLGVAPTGRAHPMRHLPYNGPAVLPDWLRTRAGDRPLVCLTAGTMMAGLGLPDRFGLRRVAGALAAGGAEVVIAVEPSQVPGLAGTPGVRVALPPLALHLVLPQCAALVHQGGAGTLMAGLAAGVPQLVLPQVSDQHFNAARLAAVGAGTSLEPAEATDVALGAALASLLDPDGGPALAAAAVRAAFAALPAPAAVVGVLEDLAHEGAP